MGQRRESLFFVIIILSFIIFITNITGRLLSQLLPFTHGPERERDFLRPHSSSVTKVGLAYRNLDPFPTTFPNPLYTFKGGRRRTELNLPSGSLCSPWRNSNLDSALTGFGIKMCENWSSLLRARDQGAFRVERPRLGL